jgi:hypothetical protein
MAVESQKNLRRGSSVVEQESHKLHVGSSILPRVTKDKYGMFKLPFDTPYTFSELVNLSRTQAKQDLFVLAMFEGKTKGTFLELGAARPIINSNCQLLERYFDWSGVSMDILPCMGWEEQRKQSQYVIADATEYDYSVFGDYFDYLQIDIDDPIGQTKILQLLADKEFGVVTLEHDVFERKAEYFAWKNFARKYFTSRGYIVLADNICVNVGDWKTNCFEDWYVNPKVIRKEVIAAYQNLTLDYRLKYGEDVLFTQND